jgi:hypothetical protein
MRSEWKVKITFLLLFQNFVKQIGASISDPIVAHLQKPRINFLNFATGIFGFMICAMLTLVSLIVAVLTKYCMRSFGTSGWPRSGSGGRGASRGTLSLSISRRQTPAGTMTRSPSGDPQDVELAEFLVNDNFKPLPPLAEPEEEEPEGPDYDDPTNLPPPPPTPPTSKPPPPPPPFEEPPFRGFRLQEFANILPRRSIVAERRSIFEPSHDYESVLNK